MWDERYSAKHYIYGIEPNVFLASHFNAIPKGGNVLCLAEGEGRNAVFLAKQGYAVTAVDVSRVGLDKAARLARANSVDIELVHSDLRDYPIGQEQWDGIVSVFCHLQPELRKPLHRRVVDGLKRGGVLLLEAYTPEQLRLGTGGPPSEALMMDAGMLAHELGGLSFHHLVELKREVIEGDFHTGVGAVVQVIASK